LLDAVPLCGAVTPAMLRTAVLGAGSVDVSEVEWFAGKDDAAAAGAGDLAGFDGWAPPFP
jgi:hypothetical protein